jgi:hypothetical protein
LIAVTIAPVSAASAQAWVENADRVLDCLERGREKVPFALPIETLEQLRDFLDEVCAQVGNDTSEVTVEFEVTELRNLMTYWFNITMLDETQRDRLGIAWTPPRGRGFADALAGGVASAMANVPELAAFAGQLAVAWEDCQPQFGAAIVAP